MYDLERDEFFNDFIKNNPLREIALRTYFTQYTSEIYEVFKGFGISGKQISYADSPRCLYFATPDLIINVIKGAENITIDVSTREGRVITNSEGSKCYIPEEAELIKYGRETNITPIIVENLDEGLVASHFNAWKEFRELGKGKDRSQAYFEKIILDVSNSKGKQYGDFLRQDFYQYSNEIFNIFAAYNIPPSEIKFSEYPRSLYFAASDLSLHINVGVQKNGMVTIDVFTREGRVITNAEGSICYSNEALALLKNGEDNIELVEVPNVDGGLAASNLNAWNLFREQLREQSGVKR